MKDAESARLEQLSAKLDANVTLTDKLKEDFVEQLKAREQYDEDRERLSARLTELEIRLSEITDARTEMDISRSEMLDRKDELDKLMTDVYIGITEIRKDIERLSKNHIVLLCVLIFA